MRSADAAGFVLAGGQSSRMGTDKALVSFTGEPLLAHALHLLRDAGLEASIAGAHCQLGAFAPVVEDRELNRGPLSGVCAALAANPAPWTVLIPIDLPLLPASLLESMLRRARISGSVVTLVSVNCFPQTFPAVLHRSLLPALQRELDAGRLGCFAAFRAAAKQGGEAPSILPVELLAQAGQAIHPSALPPFNWFLNLNTPEELSRAEFLAARLIA